MAGDEYYILLNDNNKNTLAQLYLGKLRYYSNQFSLQKYRFLDDLGHYKIEGRLSDGRNGYSILSMKEIYEIQKSLLVEPITEEEQEAYNDTKTVIEWINSNLKEFGEKYNFSTDLNPNTMHLVFLVECDF